MRALTIVSALALTLSALAACSAQPDGSPPRGGGGATGTAGATGVAGATSGFAGANGVSGSTSGFSGSTGSSGSTGFAGAPPAGGGDTGTAGAAPTGGGCTVTKMGLGTDGLIDNFETHPMSALIPASDGRVGGWWISVNQTTGNVTIPAIGKTGMGPLPVMGGMGGGMALHFAGTDTDAVKGWGADASVALAATGNCYDASAYTGGIKVSLMGTGSVYLQVITAEDKAAMATSGNQRKEIAITSTWTDYTIPWSDLITGWGTPIALDQKAVFALDVAPSATSAVNFDIWIDNLTFVK